jgi:NADP-reducing hydrogenase subunit HndD
MFGIPIGTGLSKARWPRRCAESALPKSYDTDFGADLTIMEEANEFVRKTHEAYRALPLITSCSPGWVKLLRVLLSGSCLLDNLSSCKSPHRCSAPFARPTLQRKSASIRRDIVQCLRHAVYAKKFEIHRPEIQDRQDYPDVDAALTTRELGRMIKMYGIDFATICRMKASIRICWANYSGAGVIFGASGGVMEAALRTVKEVLGDGKPLENIDFLACRGTAGVKEAEVDDCRQPKVLDRSHVFHALCVNRC